jgi:hypothetical protein
VENIFIDLQKPIYKFIDTPGEGKEEDKLGLSCAKPS